MQKLNYNSWLENYFWVPVGVLITNYVPYSPAYVSDIPEECFEEVLEELEFEFVGDNAEEIKAFWSIMSKGVQKRFEDHLVILIEKEKDDYIF